MRADSLTSTEEVSLLSTRTSKGVFPEEYVCERDPVSSAPSEMDPEMPCSTTLKKHEFWMAIPAVTREYTPGSHHNWRKTMRLPLGERWGTIPLHCMQSNSRFPIKHIRILDLFDGTSESPQEHPHKSRMTLMSPKECEIVRCITNQLEMMPDSIVLDLLQSPTAHHTRHVACLSFGNSRDSLRHPSQI